MGKERRKGNIFMEIEEGWSLTRNLGRSARFPFFDSLQISNSSSCYSLPNFPEYMHTIQHYEPVEDARRRK